MRFLWRITTVVVFILSFSGCSCERRQTKDEERYAEMCTIAICENDFSTAHKCLGYMYSECLEALSDCYSIETQSGGVSHQVAQAARRRVEAKMDEYYTGAFDAFYSEAKWLLASSKDDYCRHIATLFFDLHNFGEKYPAGTEYHNRSNPPKVDKYIRYVQENNKLCNAVLDLSITYGDSNLAKIMLTKYLENVVIERREDHHGIDREYIYYRNDDEIAAREKYNKAVKEGMLGNASLISSK